MRHDAIGIHHETRVDRRPQFLDMKFARTVDTYFCDGADRAQKRPMYSDAETVTVRQFAPPTRHRCDLLDNCGVTGRVDRVRVESLTVIGILRAIVCRIDLAGRTCQTQQVVSGILAGQVGQFVGESAHRKSMVDIANGAQPADAYMRFRISRFEAHVRNRERVINHAESELETTGSGRLSTKRRAN